MPSQKQRILDWIYRQTFESVRVSMEDILLAAARSVLGMENIEAESYALSRKEAALNWIRERIEEERKKGLLPTFQLLQHSDQLLWYPGHFPDDISSKERRLKYRLQARSTLLRLIDKLTPRQYEALGCVVCDLLGAKHIYLTPHGNEHGIDFVAILPISGRSHLFSGQQGFIRIVGQCKMYNSKVQRSTIDEFITTLTNLRYRNPSVEKIVPTWFYIYPSPIIGWVIGHQGLASGAEDTAKQHGIVISDTRDTVEIIAKSRIWSTEEGIEMLRINTLDCIDGFLAGET